VAEITFALTDEQQMLRDTTRSFLQDGAPAAIVREVTERPEGFDRDLWKAGADLGWHGLAIPERYGGLGFGFPELSIVLEELGRALFPGPFLSTVVMAANMLLLAGSEQQKLDVLPRIASGDLIVTLALFDTPHGTSANDVTLTAREASGSWMLDGAKHHVPYGHAADMLLVAARTGENELGLFLVSGDTGGITANPIPTLDMTRRQAEVTFNNVQADARLHAFDPDTIDRVLLLGNVALAIEQVGGAQWCLETSVEHAKTRYQFGRAVGSFQAVKHKCADMLVSVEHAKSAAYWAARNVDDEDETRIASPTAKITSSAAYLFAAGETIQILGGTGFTWEHDAHLYLKRAKATSLLLGGERRQRRLLADALGL
jgi:alkylation response protein AidB-like acyl-CoA dehydrogenase